MKKEKDLRDTLGPKLDQLTKQADKCVVLIEIPEAIKLNGAENLKMSKIK